jgi:glucose-6-phosphate isomerase
VVPADLIGFSRSLNPLGDHQDVLVANMLAQAEALAFGRDDEELRAAGVPEALIPHKRMPGNRPTTVLLLDQLSPFALGSLVALYEHATFTQGVVWGIDSFDQWGVELGKVLATTIAGEIATGAADGAHDASTLALLEHYRRSRLTS